MFWQRRFSPSVLYIGCSGQAAIIEKPREMIDECEAENQVSFISFSLTQLQRAREAMPGISAGCPAAPTASASFEQIASLFRLGRSKKAEC